MLSKNLSVQRVKLLVSVTYRKYTCFFIFLKVEEILIQLTNIDLGKHFET